MKLVQLTQQPQTTQCEAFNVCTIKFRARGAHTYAQQLLACVGLTQAHPNNSFSCFIPVLELELVFFFAFLKTGTETNYNEILSSTGTRIDHNLIVLVNSFYALKVRVLFAERDTMYNLQFVNASVMHVWTLN